MIDLHSHILPGIDDGAQTLEESLMMARAAVKEGINQIVATPHHLTTRYTNTKASIIKQVEDFNEHLKQEGIPLEVLPGQEARLSADFWEAYRQGEILPVNGDSGYLFIELPNMDVPGYTERVIFDLQKEGFKPIIVHPERNQVLQKQPDLLFRMVRNGAFTQVTAASLIGKFGKDAKKFAFQLIKSNLTHLVASDAHDTKKRGFYMKAAYDSIGRKFDNSLVYQYMENAHYVLNGEMVLTDRPTPIRKKKGIGIF
ncbi:tyrosine protein phosphatase [Halobacillus yeomjeoni]|uniref:tyrosine-protein phosphatase n=1 Tax=Halobacillus yeomjeoni TaxID=311194 RepID=UPI001CD30157|nr:CpsB/CapC family capsule biosynthesis tyrosine phosphatase [Halobacillus yeomjeoni]MCA0985136.1 tyrosine protein phosphatase [Halobacillus yeomjeoni]